MLSAEREVPSSAWKVPSGEFRVPSGKRRVVRDLDLPPSLLSGAATRNSSLGTRHFLLSTQHSELPQGFERIEGGGIQVRIRVVLRLFERGKGGAIPNAAQSKRRLASRLEVGV